MAVLNSAIRNYKNVFKKSLANSSTDLMAESSTLQLNRDRVITFA